MQKLVSSAFKSSWRPKHTLSSYSRPVTNNFSSLIRQNSALAENDARSQDQHETESLCEHPPRLPATQKRVPRVPAKGKNLQEPPTTVVVHHLDPAWDERYLYEQLKQFGDINGLWIKRARTGESRGIALVNFTSREAVRHLIHSRPRRPVFVDGHLLKLDWSRSQRRGQQAQWLVVLNLPDGMRPKEVMEAFAPFHPIQLELRNILGSQKAQCMSIVVLFMRSAVSRPSGSQAKATTLRQRLVIVILTLLQTSRAQLTQ